MHGYHHGSAALDGNLFVLGKGENYEGPAVYCMDLSTQTQTWTKKSVMQTPRFRLSVVQLGGKLYFIGGHLSTDLDF